MKKSSAFRIPHLAVFFGIFLLISACTKFDPAEQRQGSGEAKDRDPLSVSAIQEVVTDSFEFYGNTLYEHLKYRFTTNEPEEYLGPALGPSMKAAVDSIQTADTGKTNQQKLNELLTAGYLTPLAVQKFNDFSTLMDSYGDTEPTFGKVWYDIRDFERQIHLNNSANLDDLEPVLAFTSLMRAHIKYQYEIGQFENDDRFDECFLGRKISCWKDLGLDIFQASIKAALGESFGATVAFALIKKAVWKAAGIAAIYGLAKMYLDKKCKCEDEPANDPCKEPSGVTLAIANGCNPLEQKLEVYGQGSGANWYEWNIINGIFPANNSTELDGAWSSVFVRQNDPNVPIEISLKVGYVNDCGLGYEHETPVIIFDLPAIVNGTGTVSVLGPSTGINHNDPSIFTYSCIGTWLANPNTVMTAMAPSFHGTIMSSTISTVNVKWNIPAPLHAPASVYATVKNNCSNNQVSAWLTPIAIY